MKVAILEVRMKRWGIKLFGVLLFAASVASLSRAVFADRFSSTSYVIDASISNNTSGGTSGSPSYELTSSTGENAVGMSASGSYKMGMGYVAQLDKSLTLTAQSSGLVGYYPFEEGGGKFVYDQSASAKQVSLVAQTFTTGKVGGALLLDGTANAAVINDTAAYDFQSSDFTVEYWENLGSAAVTKDIMGKWQDGVGGFSVSYVNGQPAMFLNNSGVYRYCSTTSAGVWTHVAFVKSGTTLNCYENGVLANGTLSGAIPANIGATTQPFKVGLGRYSGSGADSVDEVKLFSRALSADEVSAEYQAQNAGVTAGLHLGAIIPGSSNSVLEDVITQTDTGSYSLAINQDHDLTNGSYTIPAISGSIAAPLAWSEGSTTGFGFTLTATNGTAIPGAWSSGNSYAAFPGAATTFYSRVGTQTTPDYVTMRLRADVTSSQVSTTTPYVNTITVTGTIIP